MNSSLLKVLTVIAVPSLLTAADISSTYDWKPVKLGAGGFTMGISIQPKTGDTYCRIDVNGAYKLDKATGVWEQIMTADRMPPGCPMVENVLFNGVQSLVVAPSDPQRLYAAYGSEYVNPPVGALYTSDNAGKTWARISAQKDIQMGANDGFSRIMGERLAVDPVNADVCFFGSGKQGMYVTTDGGKSWTQLPESVIPAGKPGDNGKEVRCGIGNVAYDPTSPVVDGRTQRLYASVWGKGLYRSEDAGKSWQPFWSDRLDIMKLVLASDGTIYLLCGHNTNKDPETKGPKTFAIFRMRDGAWKDISSPQRQIKSLGVKADDPNVVISTPNISFDAGETWQEIEATTQSNDIPWLAKSIETIEEVAAILSDPTQPNIIWAVQGIGNWRLDLNKKPLVWESVSAGIESMVANGATKVPGGPLICVVMDRMIFPVDNPDEYQQRYIPDMGFGGGRSPDYCSQSPKYQVALARKDIVVSSDNGKTWDYAPAREPEEGATVMTIAMDAADPKNMVAVDDQGILYVTKDGAATWSKSVMPTEPKGGTIYLTSDKAQPGTFYYLHRKAGLLVSQDNGVTFTVQAAMDSLPVMPTASIISDRTRPGHLITCSGSPRSNGVIRSTDFGKTWTKVDGFGDTGSAGMGKAQTEGGPATLFARGFYNKEIGTWRSTDDGKTWDKIDTHPRGINHMSEHLAGDWEVFGKLTLGLRGNAFSYGQPK